MNQGTDEERMGQRHVARRSPALGALLGLLGLLLLARPAAAQGVEIEVAGPEGPEIAEAVRQELSRPGHLSGTVVVHTDPRARTLRVVFTPEGGAPPVERTVPLPDAPRERARVAAFLARNLTSDEADELLRELQTRSEVPPRPVELPPEQPQAAPPAEPAPGVAAHDVAPQVTVAAPVKEPCAAGAPQAPVALSLFSPLGLPSMPARANVAYGALYGDLAEIRGVGTGLVLRVRCDSRGVVMTSLGSVVQGRSLGLLVAGGFNVTTGRAAGVALSGGLNVHTGPVQGLTASTVTVATGGLEGAQIGLINIGGSVTGAQVGILNIGSAVRGAQVGVVNIAGPVTGAQLGVLNVAKEVDAAVGALASISWAHRIRAVAWLSSIAPLQVGVQFEGKRMSDVRRHLLRAPLPADPDRGRLLSGRRDRPARLREPRAWRDLGLRGLDRLERGRRRRQARRSRAARDALRLPGGPALRAVRVWRSRSGHAARRGRRPSERPVQCRARVRCGGDLLT